MKLKVLIVEDDEIVTFLHKKMVQKQGLSGDPINFIDGIFCYDYLKNHSKEDEFYLILLDINMPQMNGWQFLNEIQNQPFVDQLAVIMVTSSIDSIDREKANTYSQVIEYFEKPLDMETCARIKSLPEVSSFFDR